MVPHSESLRRGSSVLCARNTCTLESDMIMFVPHSPTLVIALVGISIPIRHIEKPGAGVVAIYFEQQRRKRRVGELFVGPRTSGGNNVGNK